MPLEGHNDGLEGIGPPLSEFTSGFPAGPPDGGLSMSENTATGLAQLDCRLGSLMVAAQGGDRLAYRQLLAAVAARVMDACRQDVRTQEWGAAEVAALACGILQAVHTARATFDPRSSFEAWLSAIISTRLAASTRQHRAVAQAATSGIAKPWYRRLFAA